MRPPAERALEQEIPVQLARLLGVSRAEVKARRELQQNRFQHRSQAPSVAGRPERAKSRWSPRRLQADFLLQTPAGEFVVEFKRSASAGTVDAALRQVEEIRRQLAPRALPLLVVPYMGETGKHLCEEAGTSWFDLSGNARIERPGLRIRVEGQPNRFIQRGRPSSVFAPKASRIVRWLLMNPGRRLSQRELATATAMDEGFTSRLVRRLEREEFIVRDGQGLIRVRNPNVLLQAWREAYDFSKHETVQGLVAARSGEELLRRITGTFSSRQLDYAVTGLGAAWLLSKFAAFRTVTLFVREMPSPEILRLIGFRAEPSGANVWLVLPNDEDVFHGSLDREGVRCVHPVQIYMDLKDQPERADEAADRLREQFLNWSSND